jgi:TPR repeat protein
MHYVALSASLIVLMSASSNNSLAANVIKPVSNVNLSEAAPPWEARPDVNPEAYSAQQSKDQSVDTSSDALNVPLVVPEQPDHEFADYPPTDYSQPTIAQSPAPQQPVVMPVQAYEKDHAVDTSSNIAAWHAKRQQQLSARLGDVNTGIIDALKRKASSGDIDAQYQLGNRFQTGHQVKANIYQAIHWFTQAGNAGHSQSQYALALIYKERASTSADLAKSVSWAKKAAESGYVEAQYHLGMMYTNGEDIARDPHQANYWLEKASQQGHVAAQIALLSEANNPQPANVQQMAAIDIEREREIKESDAPLTLDGAPQLPEVGVPVSPVSQAATMPMDPAPQVVELQQAATRITSGQDEPEEYIQVADITAPVSRPPETKLPDIKKPPQPVVNTPVVEPAPQPAPVIDKVMKVDNADQRASEAAKTASDISDDVRNVMQAAKQGDKEAQLILGAFYEDGEGGLEQSYQEAMKWYELSANQGFAKAQYNIGLLYEDGKGTNQDYYEAAQWYKRAANNGFSEAQNNLGVLYIMGKGVMQDKNKAELMFRRAAEQGNKNAERNLSMLLSEK